MRKIIIGSNDAGQRLDKFLCKAVPSLPQSLLYKYLRLKRIKLNGKKAAPSIRLQQGDLLELKVCADGFLYNMVRAITGTVLYAAEGKFAPEDIPAILESGDRTAAGPTVPPGGLYLTRLWYGDERLNG